jgi:membrane protein
MVDAKNVERAEGRERGRQAIKPWQIPRRGWKDILLRTKDSITEHSIGIVSAGVAFYAMLAIFPALAALVSIYGLIADPAQIQQQVSELSGVMPSGVMTILQSQLTSLASGGTGALTAGLIFSILLTLWSASKAMGALITALNIVYYEHEKRGFVKPYVVSLILTLGAIVFAIVTLFLIVAVPAALSNLALPDLLQILIRIARWILLAAAIIFGLSVVYRYAPSRSAPQWQWVSVGAIVGAALWLTGSALFAIYVENFGNYNKTYGTFASVIILMLWFNLSAFAALIGAEINAEMEHQTAEDTTTGAPRAQGERGAYVADNLGKRPRGRPHL